MSSHWNYTECAVKNSSNLTENFPHNVSCPTDMSGLVSASNQAMGGGLSIGLLFVMWGVTVVSLKKNGNPFMGSVIAGNVVAMFGSFFLFIAGVLGREWPILFIFAVAGSVMASYFSRSG